MSISLRNLVSEKISGIDYTGGYVDLVSAGAIDILEKIKTYKQEDLQKFVKEVNVRDDVSPVWTQYNSVSLYAWEIVGAKRATSMSVSPDNESLGKNWRTASKLASQDKDDLLNPNSLKFITSSYPAFTVESHVDFIDDGDNDSYLPIELESSRLNYIVTIFPQVKDLFHSWKVQYIPIPESTGLSETDYSITKFHASYIPALAVYIAKNIVLGEMNRLLLLEEDLELATELKNHYALLEQEYAGLMNIPPKKETE